MDGTAVSGCFGVQFTEGVVGGTGCDAAKCGASEQTIVVVGVGNGVCADTEADDLEVVVIGATHSTGYCSVPDGAGRQEAVVDVGKAATIRGGDAGQLTTGGIISVIVVATRNRQARALSLNFGDTILNCSCSFNQKQKTPIIKYCVPKSFFVAPLCPSLLFFITLLIFEV